MAGRRLRRIAALELGLVVVLVVVMSVLSLGREPLFDTVLYGFLALSLGAAGALIVVRRPDNRIGWLFCALAVFGALAEVAEGWGLSARDLGLRGGAVGEWVISWSWILDGAMWTLVFLLFPDERLAAGWRRAVAGSALIGAVLAWVGFALSSRTDVMFSAGRNPFAVDSGAIAAAYVAGTALLLGSLVVSVVAFLLRLRRARGIERQQLKWFASAAGLVGVVLPVAPFLWGKTIVIEIAAALALSALPVAAGIAILRYRLYDIDRIVNRALVYALLTALLAGVYGVLVLLPAQVFSGTGNEPSWLVAGATLAVAALFQPARRRIQHAVDRRFNRRRYDAAHTIEAFSARLRDEIDLDTLSTELRAVVDRTMQPAAVSTWLRS